MTIYPEFEPTYLYIKQHTVTGLLYFGKTCNDPETYPGSGKYWTKHIKKHNKKHIITLWWCLFYDEASLVEYAIMCSTQWDIVNIKNELGKKIWANLRVENGLDGNPKGLIISKEWSENISKSLLGNTFAKGSCRTKEFKENLHEIRKGEGNSFFGKTHSEETLVKMRKPKTEEHIKNLKAAINNKTISHEEHENRSAAQRGKKATEETLMKMRGPRGPNKKKRTNPPKLNYATCVKCKFYGNTSIISRMHNENCNGHPIEKAKLKHEKKNRKNQNIKICSHCGLIGSGPNMSRYHFDNCKLKPV